MSKPLRVQIIERARALIEYEWHWCRGELARDASGFWLDRPIAGPRGAAVWVR